MVRELVGARIDLRGKARALWCCVCEAALAVVRCEKGIRHEILPSKISRYLGVLVRLFPLMDR